MQKAISKILIGDLKKSNLGRSGSKENKFAIPQMLKVLLAGREK
jgi:hypothetical protein